MDINTIASWVAVIAATVTAASWLFNKAKIIAQLAKEPANTRVDIAWAGVRVSPWYAKPGWYWAWIKERIRQARS